MYQMPRVPIRYVFDGGGNLGLFSLAAAAQLPVEALLIVEPDPENFALLEANLSCIPNTTRVRAALAAKDGTAFFNRHRRTRGI